MLKSFILYQNWVPKMAIIVPINCLCQTFWLRFVTNHI